MIRNATLLIVYFLSSMFLTSHIDERLLWIEIGEVPQTRVLLCDCGSHFGCQIMQIMTTCRLSARGTRMEMQPFGVSNEQDLCATDRST